MEEKIQNQREIREAQQQEYAFIDSLGTGLSSETILAQKLRREKMTKSYDKLRLHCANNSRVSLSHLEIPITNATRWEKVTEPAEINRLRIARNIKHFGQAKDTLFASEPMSSYFDYTGTNENSSQFLSNAEPLRASDEATQMILDRLQTGPHSQRLEDIFTIEEFRTAFKKWDESTSTSSFSRHLGHYKSLLVADCQNSKYTENSPNP